MCIRDRFCLPQRRGQPVDLSDRFPVHVDHSDSFVDWINEKMCIRDRDEAAKALADNLEIVVNESIDWYNRNKEEFYQMTKSSIAGYGLNYPTALESRLKFFETYSRPCTGYEMEEQMHGPMRAYNQDNYIFMIASEGRKELERLKELVPYYKDVFTEHVFVVTWDMYAGLLNGVQRRRI